MRSRKLKGVYSYNLIYLIWGHYVLILLLEELICEYFLNLTPDLRHIDFVAVAYVHQHYMISERTILDHFLILYFLNKSFNDVLILFRADSWEEE